MTTTTKPAILAELPDYGKVEPRLVDPETAERWLSLNQQDLALVLGDQKEA